MRMVYFDEGEHAGRLFWTIHHLAVDGVSWRILLEDLQTAYTQVVQGQKIQLPMKSTSLKNGRRNYIITLKRAYQRSATLLEEQAEQDVVKLPVDGTISNPVSAVTEEITVVLNENETRMLLQETLSTHRVQINEVLLASTSYGMYGRPILSVDLEGHGREEIIEDVDLSRTVGWFTSIYPVHLNITSANTPIEALKAVKEQVRKILIRVLIMGVALHERNNV